MNRVTYLSEKEYSCERILIISAETIPFQVPLSKEPKWLWDTMSRWLVTCQKKLSDSKDAETSEIPGRAQFIKSLNLVGEVSWLKKYLATNPSPVVFCHNDFQEGNILVCRKEQNNGEPKLVIIGKNCLFRKIYDFLGSGVSLVETRKLFPA